jgi:cytochrome c553
MKPVILKLALRPAVLVVALAAGAQVAQGREGAGGLQAKMGYCLSCHGLSGEGYRGEVAMPRLAGQQPEYIEEQLRAYSERRRLNPIMVNVTHGLNPGMVEALAARFKSLDPAPYGGAPREDLGLGKSIFETGLPESNIPACSACHGSAGKGRGQIPRLAGQLYWYTVKALSGWGRERGQGAVEDTSAVMSTTSHNLSAAQISAIAAYVSNLK